MNEIRKIELITELETDNKTVLFDHIQENEKDFEEVRLNIEELDSKLQNIQLTPGEKGDRGDKGDKGDTGDRGLDGKDGIDGINGLDGLNGENGKDGNKGEQGEKGDKPKHRWKGSQLQFEKPDGTWGQLIDLRGSQGQMGLSGGSLGASYPLVKLNGNLLTTGAREFNFSGGITASVSGTSVSVETDDLSGYVPYTGATTNVDLGVHNLTVDTNTLFVDSANHRVGIGTLVPSDLFTVVGNARVTGVLKIADGSVTAPSLAHRADENTGIYFPTNDEIAFTTAGVQRLTITELGITASTGFHIGEHGGGASTAVPLFLYDNYGAGVKIQTTKMDISLGYNAILPDPTLAQEDYYFLFGTSKGTSKKVGVYTDEYGLTSYNSLGFNSTTNTLTVGDTTTQGSIELTNSTRTLTLRAPTSTYTLTFPAVPGTTQTPQLAATGIMTTIANTGSGNNVLSLSPSITTPSITNYAIITRTALGSTTTYGLYLRNTTASTALNSVQFSPATQYFGTGWDTDGSTSVSLTGQIYLSTISGTDVKSQLRFDMDESGAGLDTKMRLTNTGQLGVGANATNPQADISVGGNGIANTGLFVGLTGYSYAQVLVSDSGGEELFKIKDDISDASFSIGLGDITDVYSYGSFILTYNKAELTYADLSIVDKNIILGTTTGTKIGTSTSQKLGFYNATPIVQPTAITTALTTITYTAPGTPDYALQDVTNIAPYGFTDAEELRTFISVVKNLQDRVNNLETKLQSLGLIA